MWLGALSANQGLQLWCIDVDHGLSQVIYRTKQYKILHLMRNLGLVEFPGRICDASHAHITVTRDPPHERLHF